LEENFDRFKIEIHKEKEMVSFRRCIIAMAILALFVGLASAQSTTAQLNCSANTANPTAARAEGHTELLGDIVITCLLPATSSTFVPTAGTAVTTANITVALGQPVTSRIFSSSTGLSDALLLIDEPGSGTTGNAALPQTPCLSGTAASLSGAGFGGCSTFVNPGPFTVAGPGGVGTATVAATAASLCTTVTGATCGTLTSTGAAVPNVFQGIVPPGITNQVVFNGIPILAPSSTGVRVFRITNIRADVTGVGSSGGTTPITASVTASNALQLTNATPIVAFIFQGLNAGQSGARNTANSAAGSISGLQQCVTLGLTSGSVLRFTEGFANAFKTRFGNGTGATSTTTVVGIPTNQNVPGSILTGSESGFITTINGNTTGLADFGTRLKATFANVPSGVSIFVSTTNINPLGNTGVGINTNVGTNTQALQNLLTGGIPTTINNSFSFLAGLVLSETTGGGSGGFLPLQPPSNNGNFGNVSVPVFGPLPVDANGTASAVWEVLLTNPAASESAEFGVFYTVASNPSTNTPPTSPAGTVALSFAPTTATPGGTGPIPRFVPSSTSSSFITVAQCKTVLLFPFVSTVTAASFDTGIAISNTSQDTFGTRPQSGTCVLHFFADAATNPADFTTPVIGPAATDNANKATYTLGLSSIPAYQNFQGYVIAECNFLLGHGFALFSDTGIRNWATGYLALNLPTGTSARNSGALLFNGSTSATVENVAH